MASGGSILERELKKAPRYVVSYDVGGSRRAAHVIHIMPRMGYRNEPGARARAEAIATILRGQGRTVVRVELVTPTPE